MTDLPTLSREALFKALGGDARLVAAFEQTQQVISETQDATTTGAEATQSIQDATVLTLSANTAFTNERVLKFGPGVTFKDDGQFLTILADDKVAHTAGGFRVNLVAQALTTLLLPISGQIATIDQAEELLQKTLDAPSLSNIPERATDAAATVGEVYTLPASTALHYKRA